MIGIGILALQGNFNQHRALLQKIMREERARKNRAPMREERAPRKTAREERAPKKPVPRNKTRIILVREPHDLQHCHGLILPGGESTTMSTLLHKSSLFAPLQRGGLAGFPIFGVCAGAILLAKSIIGTHQQTLGVMDISIERNGYGRQINSFEASVSILPDSEVGRKKVSGIFIRAPIIRAHGDGIRIIAYHRGVPVAVQQHATLAITFHPETRGDTGLHQFFLTKCINHEKTFAAYTSN